MSCGVSKTFDFQRNRFILHKKVYNIIMRRVSRFCLYFIFIVIYITYRCFCLTERMPVKHRITIISDRYTSVHIAKYNINNLFHIYVGKIQIFGQDLIIDLYSRWKCIRIIYV